MPRSIKNRLLLALAVCAVVAGATAAVVMAAQPAASPHHGKAAARRHHRKDASRSRTGTGSFLTAAARYLGTTRAKLRAEFQAGKSLAEIAAATPGRSTAGLVAALEAAGKAKLAASAADLSKRVSTEVNRVGHRGAMLTTAATYLGLTPRQLHTDLRAGKSLADIAKSTPDKSEAGLVEALVASRKSELMSAVSAGKITQAHADDLLPRLTQRITARADRVHARA